MAVIRYGGDRDPMWLAPTMIGSALFRRRNDALLFAARSALYGSSFVPVEHGFMVEQSGKADAKRVRYTSVHASGWAGQNTKACDPVLYYSKKHDRRLKDKLV